ncbi:MAG: malonyl-[acyl-carrier protein] O-methyltransferase BioC [Gammaproteobacteria bacterium]|nr:MAG: malonyl-[acyl-carrier protein] O-methyltransferase BioC [Gammaproteobacteria bacterium]
MSVNVQLDKQAIANSFSRAASRYDAAASLQRNVGDELMRQIPLAEGRVFADGTTVDLGCGTGYFTARLQDALAGPVIGLDLAEGMLSQARTNYQATNTIDWLCGDAENLPLASDSVDCLFSSFALQWCSDLQRAFSECYRVLKRGGYLLVSLPVQGTLIELEQSWKAVDQERHVNDFFSEQEVAAWLAEVFQHHPEKKNHELFSVVTETRFYSQLNQLLRELKDLGAHNINRDRVKSLTTKGQYRALHQAYETYRTDQQLLPASYQVAYVCYRKG